jgi:hypothetical protein
MIHSPETEAKRELKAESLTADFAIAGGGLAGTCAAITAAREGLSVVLIQDRPILGGNASSEVRLWVLGATSHMGNNNRWAREGGVVDEILVENLHRNPEGNAVLFDTILLDKVIAEPNIRLLLNTAVVDLDKEGSDRIASVTAFCSQNSTRYTVAAPLFCDASGDGILGFLSGAAFRMGAESRQEFGEGFAPEESYGELLGHTIYFYSKDTGKPVRFIPPSYALADVALLPHYKQIRARDSGCAFWWFEYGGRRDTVHDTEEIKWELWQVVYGVWNYIKNSGKFPEAENLTLEWVGTIPGKRESRRFEGDVILKQQNLVEQTKWEDAVSFGGWAMDLHPADGVYSDLSPCTQWHSKGAYSIPYRALYSRNIRNLFLAGRIISASHVAFGSARVQATCANSAQAVAMAAVACSRKGLLPADLAGPEHMHALQQDLLKTGQFIPGAVLLDPADLAQSARIDASSRYVIREMRSDGTTSALDRSRAMLLPVAAGPVPTITVVLNASSDTTLEVELRTSSRRGNFTPDRIRGRLRLPVAAGEGQRVTIRFDEVQIAEAQYAFLCLMRNDAVAVHLTTQRLTGILSLSQSMNAAVARSARQEPPAGTGVDTFEFWLPSRRPGGKNFAMVFDPPLDPFPPENVVNGLARPTIGTNAWVASPDDAAPTLVLRWPQPQKIGRIELGFDTDFDHPMESVLMGHPERDMPFCVKRYRVKDRDGAVLHACEENHQTRNSIRLAQTVSTDELKIEVLETHGAPAALFEVRCYEA